MSVEIITPKTREEWLIERHKTVGSSETPALLGISPFKDDTPLSLFYRKRAQIDLRSEMTRALRRGLLMEDDALSILQDDHPDWTITPNPPAGGKFFRDLSDGISCTPDAFIEAPGRPRGICQVKTVNKFSFKRAWLTDGGDIEPPLYVAVQAVQDASLTGAEWAIILAMVMDDELDTFEVEVPIHAGLIGRIKSEARKFWDDVKAGHPPAADYSRDGDVIAALYPPKHDLPPIDLSSDNVLPEIVAEREELMARTRVDEKRKKEIDAEIAEKLAGHSIGTLADGTRILRTMQERNYKARDAYTISFPQIKIKRAAA